jgi:phytoene desaturase
MVKKLSTNANRRKVVIVGAGVGGIYSACRLAKHGFDVTVVEKNNQPGGRCNRIEKDGYSFDTGPTFLMMPEIYSRAFSDLGEKIEDHLELIRVDPNYEIYFPDGTHLTMSTDKNQMRKQLEAIEPGSYDSLTEYLKEGEENYKLAMRYLIDRDFQSFFDYFNFRNLYLIFKLKLLVNHYKHIGRFFKDQRLKEAFTFQDSYLGYNPFHAPAMMSMFQYLEQVVGVWLPKGGMYSVVKAFEKLAEDSGVKFIFDSPVKKIDIKNISATGVTFLNGQKIAADYVIANADLSYVYRALLPRSKTSDTLQNKKYTCSVISFFWGMDKNYPHFGTHNLFLSNEYQRSFNQVTEELIMPDDPNFYIHAPGRVDSSRAPKNHDSIVAIVPVGHLTEHNSQEWQKHRDTARRIVLDRLRKIGIDDFEDHIKFEVNYTPNMWANQFNLTNGSTLGLAHNIQQMGYLRPKSQHKKYRNLFFVGASTHPGSGVPTVLISARLTTERILKRAKS